MSIYLKNNNWLVADWVMRKLKEDLSFVDEEKKMFFDIWSKLQKSEELYTFLLDYSSASSQDVSLLVELTREILQRYEDGRIEFSGSIEAFTSYIQKIRELQKLAEEESSYDYDV